MLDLFSTREQAMGIWIVLFFLYVLSRKRGRDAWKPFIKCLFAPRLVITAMLLCTVGGAAAYFASKLPLWDNAYYKDVIMWIVFVGLPLCFGAISSKESGYYRNAVIDNVKATVLFECVFSTFTFPLWAELLIIPVATFIGLLETIAERKEKSKHVAKLMGKLLGMGGLILLCFTIKTAIDEFQMDITIGMIASLVIPLGLSILYVPFAYSLALYAAYEVSFLRMKICEPDKWSIRFKHRLKALLICNVSLDKARILQKSARYMYKTMPEKECLPETHLE